MTLNQLKYFCETCRCHSITAAANQLFVTQPAISLAIRELEAEFGITLFTRFNNRLTLTEDGALFYKKADYILQYCKDMQFELNGSRIQQNPIHVGIPPVLSSFFFPGLIDAYRSKYPDALVSLEEYGSVRACNLVQDDTLDLALVNMEQYNIDKFNKALLANDQVVFCVSDDHRLADKEVVTTKEMSKESLIFFNADSVQNQLLKTRFETDGYVPDIIMRSSQIYTILQLVKTCKYGSFLYSSMTDRFASSGIKGIPLSPPIRIKIGMIWKKGKYISDNMQKFLNFTKMYYREHPLIQKL